MAKSKSSPVGGNRGCLGKDGKYKKENCDGDLQSQGVGSMVEQSTITIINNNIPRVITN